MAGIPLSEIPNAPRTEAPVLLERAGPRSTDIRETTRSLLSPTMNMEGARAQANAYQNLGQGVQDLGTAISKATPKIAAVVQDWQEKKTAAKDYDSHNLGVRMIDQQYAAFQQEIAGQSEPVVLERLAAFRESSTDGLKDLALTPEGRQGIEAYQQRRLNDAKLLGLTTSNTQFINQGRANSTALYESLMEEGRFGDAQRVMQDGVRVGFYRPDEVAPLEHRTLTGIERRQMEGFIADNPFGALEYIGDYRKTGQNPHFARLSAEEMANSEIRAQTATRDLQRRKGDEIDTAVLSGDIRDEATIRHLAAHARLSEDEVKSHIASLREVPVNTPVERANYLRAQSDIATIVAGYDPQEDPGDSYYSSLKRAVRQYLPMADRSAVLQQLNERREKGITPADRVRAQTYEQIDTLATSGVLGTFQSGQGEVNAERMTRVYSKVRLLKDDFTKFLKAQPDATSADQRKWLADRVANQVILRGARVLRGGNRSSSSGGPQANKEGGR